MQHQEAPISSVSGPQKPAYPTCDGGATCHRNHEVNIRSVLSTCSKAAHANLSQYPYYALHQDPVTGFVSRNGRAFSVGATRFELLTPCCQHQRHRENAQCAACRKLFVVCTRARCGRCSSASAPFQQQAKSCSARTISSI